MDDSPRKDSLEVEPVAGRAGMEAFLRLPWALYRDDPNWVPPLLAERRSHLDPKANPYFTHAEARFWLARRDGRPVGRISAQVDRAYLDRHRDATGHFGHLEAEDDPAVFRALLGAAEAWLAGRGMRRVTGPFSLSINDECGLLVEGFEAPPSLMMGHARPYYARRVEEQGYAKARDLIAYHYDVRRPMPREVLAMADKAVAERRLRLRALRGRNYGREIAAIVSIFNDAWAENWGFVPLSQAEVSYLALSLRPILRKDLVCIAEVDREPAAMAVCVPDLNEMIADLDGRLWPFGWARLLWRLRVGRPRRVRVLLMGVRRRFQGTLLGAALPFAVINAVREAALRRGVTSAELSWVLEDNLPMRRLVETIGARPYKTYRVYEKALA